MDDDDDVIGMVSWMMMMMRGMNMEVSFEVSFWNVETFVLSYFKRCEMM